MQTELSLSRSKLPDLQDGLIGTQEHLRGPSAAAQVILKIISTALDGSQTRGLGWSMQLFFFFKVWSKFVSSPGLVRLSLSRLPAYGSPFKWLWGVLLSS